jgi:cation-transporting ATPase 13A2
VDDSIKEISCWKIDRSKKKKAIFLYLITFGILYIIAKIFKKLYLKLNCVPSEVKSADFFLILDETNLTFVCNVVRENFYMRSKLLGNHLEKKTPKSNLTHSPYIGFDFFNTYDQNTVLYFRHNKYIYLENDNVLTACKFDLTKFKNKELHDKFIKGMRSIEEYNYLLNKFGKNEMAMENKNFLVIFLEQFFHPFYIYQIYSIIIWCNEEYFSYACIVFVFSFTILLINSYHNWKNYNRIINFNSSAPANVIREFNDTFLAKDIKKNSRSSILYNRRESKVDSVKRQEQASPVLSARENQQLLEKRLFLEDRNSLASLYIVPGDILKIRSTDSLPCDCVILDGFCTVNESDLTGESSLVMKTPIPNDFREFSYEVNKKSFLFQGTQLSKCESNEQDGSITAIAVSTGFNTNRGNLIQNLLFPKPTNFKFYKDIMNFFLGMMVVYAITVCIMIYIYKAYLEGKSGWNANKLTNSIFDNLTIILPPSLPICMTFTSFYFHYNLNKKKISCISDHRMNAAGRVNIIVLDKTGTLTEEGLELYGFQTTKINYINNENQTMLEFDEVEPNAKVFNSLHKEFWKRFSANPQHPIFKDYRHNIQNNLIYYLECLATCHSIDKLKGDSLGNSIDKKIFDNINWIQVQREDSTTVNVLKYLNINLDKI